MKKLGLSLAFPALAILVAALAQLVATTLWPGIARIPSVVVSLDGYAVVILAMGLCCFAGRWSQRNVPGIAGAASVGAAPLAWFGLVVTGMFATTPKIAWSQYLTIFVLVAAAAPLVGVNMGWVMSASKHATIAPSV